MREEGLAFFGFSSTINWRNDYKCLTNNFYKSMIKNHVLATRDIWDIDLKFRIAIRFTFFSIEITN